MSGAFWTNDDPSNPNVLEVIDDGELSSRIECLGFDGAEQRFDNHFDVVRISALPLHEHSELSESRCGQVFHGVKAVGAPASRLVTVGDQRGPSVAKPGYAVTGR